MVFFNFNLITDPPADEFVDEQVHLNANMDKLDTRLNQFTFSPNTVTSPPIGTEAFNATSVAVWTGSSWRVPDAIPNGWSAWTTIPTQAPVAERPGWTPYWRVNPTIRCVELCGGFRADSVAGPWSKTKVQVSSLTGIPITYNPVYDSIQQIACGISSTSGQFAGARLFIEAQVTNPVKLSVAYQGDDVGGNFVMIDGVKWFY